MRRAAPEGPALEPFFRALRGAALDAWGSPGGYAYDGVLYAVHYPYEESDIARVLRWRGRASERPHLPAVRELNRQLISHEYPSLASLAPEGVSPDAWSAVLHFCDPSYPLYTPEAEATLAGLGFDVAGGSPRDQYTRFLRAVDDLKARAPVWSIPETNWYLARIIEVGLEGYAARRGRPPKGGPKPSRPARGH